MFIVLQPITGEIFTPQKPQPTNGFRSVMEQIKLVTYNYCRGELHKIQHKSIEFKLLVKESDWKTV